MHIKPAHWSFALLLACLAAARAFAAAPAFIAAGTGNSPAEIAPYYFTQADGVHRKSIGTTASDSHLDDNLYQIIFHPGRREAPPEADRFENPGNDVREHAVAVGTFPYPWTPTTGNANSGDFLATSLNQVRWSSRGSCPPSAADLGCRNSS